MRPISPENMQKLRKAQAYPFSQPVTAYLTDARIAACCDTGISEIGRDRLAERVCLSFAQLLHILGRNWAHYCSSQINDQLWVEARLLSGILDGLNQACDDVGAGTLASTGAQ